MTQERRVVITGIGAITPLGNTVDELWKNTLSGKSGAAEITGFDASIQQTRFACEVKDFDPANYDIDRKELRKVDRYAQFALAATYDALKDSNLDLDAMSPYDIGVIWGTGQGGIQTCEEGMKEVLFATKTPKLNPFFLPRVIANMASGIISIKFGLKGMNYTTVSACATSNTAIMDAYNYIKYGKMKVFVTGGSEASITQSGIAGFNAMRALSTNNENAATASRPFCKTRDGFVMGEGAGAFILEEYEHAKQRGAKIYAELVGAAMTADAYHLFAPHPEGEGAAMAMQLALKEAGLEPEEVGYLNGHSTSTPIGDVSEIHAVTKVFGNDLSKLHISGTKSMTGHLLGAAGVVESILCVKSITDGAIPPTINVKELDPEIPEGVQIVLDKKLEKKVDVAMTNSFGFGGHNASLIFKRME